MLKEMRLLGKSPSLTVTFEHLPEADRQPRRGHESEVHRDPRTRGKVTTTARGARDPTATSTKNSTELAVLTL
jgi:hypothetical protein